MGKDISLSVHIGMKAINLCLLNSTGEQIAALGEMAIYWNSKE